jgi:uncharacterized protein YkwD
MGKIIEVKLPKTTAEQIADLQAQIKALKAEKKIAGVKTPRAKRPSVELRTPGIREAKAAAEAEVLMAKIRKLAGNPLNELSSSQVVDAYMGGLVDLPELV